MDETQTTINSYNLNANAYADKFMAHEPYAKQVMEFAKLLAAGGNVLDIGCGPGNVAKQMLMAKPLRITGFDLSAEMVKLASENVSSGNFFCQDVRLADFPDSCFDAVILSFSIVHLNNAEAHKLLNKAISWTKKEGHFFVSFMEGKKAGFEQTSFSKQPIYFNYFDSEKIAQFLTEQGIKITHSVKQDYREPDGTITKDIFIFGQKLSLAHCPNKAGGF